MAKTKFARRTESIILALVLVCSLMGMTGRVYAADIDWGYGDYEEMLAGNELNMEALARQNFGLPAKVLPDGAQELSDEIVGTETDPYQQAKAVYDWMVRNIKFDPPLEAMAQPFYTNGYYGVCENFATAFQELCWAQGIPCVMINGQSFTGGKQVGHAWNAFYTDGDWHLVDTTWGKTLKTENWDFSVEQLTRDQYGNMRVTVGFKTKSFYNDWAYNAIIVAVDNQLIPTECSVAWSEKGHGNNVYQTDFTPACTRQSFAQLAVALLEACYDKDIDEILADKGVSINAGAFTDTSDPSVLAANALGIVNGIGNGQFAPDNSINRQEAAAILFRTAEILGLTSKTSDITSLADYDQIGSWARNAVSACYGLGVMQGTSDTTFSPLSEYTREQCVVTMVRLFEAAAEQ